MHALAKFMSSRWARLDYAAFTRAGAAQHHHSVFRANSPYAKRRPCRVQPAAKALASQQAAVSQQQLAQVLGPTGSDTVLLLDFPNPWAFFHVQTPTFFSVLGFLLSHPLITFGLAVFLYITVPRLWRAFVRFVVVPAGVLGVGFIVVRNPQSFSNAGSFVANFTGDHPYVTSAIILVGLTLVLSPYLLTALLVLFLVTGIPRLPGPIKRFLPAPVVEIEQQLASFDDFLREPVNNLKEQSLKLGSGLQSTTNQLFSGAQSGLKRVQDSKKAPLLRD